MKKVAFYTLGCKLNYSETSALSRKFEDEGFRKVDFTDQPDIFVINTCSVTENADRKCHKIVREAKKISPESFVVIVGCYAQLKPAEIAGIPGVDAVLGAAEKFQLLEHLKGFEKKAAPQVFHSEVQEAIAFHTSYSVQDRTRTFLKVQDGCDYVCTFCTIPMARGGSRSDTIANVVEQAGKIGESGVKEIVLTGVNTGDFGIRNGAREDRFIDLIKALDEVDTVTRFRISSIEPNLLTDEIIAFVSASRRFVPHFHVPLQSGSDKVLRMMKRRYLTALYSERIRTIRAHMPHACIGVDVIVGFPGETDADFNDTENFLAALDISYLHVFTYSERDNTPAASMRGAVPIPVRQERSRRLHALSDRKRDAYYRQQLGTVHTVLFENDIEEGMMHGFTENYVRVAVKYDPVLVNECRRVRIQSIADNGVAWVEDAEPAEVLHAGLLSR
ncbi:MAG: tRNA (N(6)-L-threonylcarbamoyladenosine(37)-C(2))-methylthiotransferase MtaB [Cyclobacteriaceae bacterium]